MKERRDKKLREILLTCLLMFYVSISVMGQGTVKDAETGKGIAFASLFSIDTTITRVSYDMNFKDFEKMYHYEKSTVYYTDEEGNFEKLDPQFGTYFIDMPGYKKKFVSGNTNGVIFLEPLPELKTESVSEFSKIFPLGKGKDTFSKWETYARRNRATQIAKFFPWKRQYDETPHLKSIKVGVRCEINKAYFRIRIYKNLNGFPGEELSAKAIVAKVRRNTSNVDINLELYKIVFPKEGMFIAFEWIVNEENKLVRRNDYNDFRLELNQPAVMFNTNKNGKSLIYSNGEWFKVQRTSNEDTEGYFEPAIGLTLTN